MPVYTTLERNGTPLPLRWGGWHLECLWLAMVAEVGEEALAYPRTWAGSPNSEPYTLTAAHTFTDPDDGEVLVIRPGDVYSAGR